MTYRAKTISGLPIFFSFYFFFMLPVLLKPFSWPILIVTLSFGLVILIIALLRYDVIMEDTKIRVVTSLFSFQLTDRTYYARNMRKIIFKRLGWQAQKAIIHMDYGITLRLPHYLPPEAYEVLDNFASSNTIQTNKTKDYKIIEKMIQHKKAAQ
mgnify:CR=1 FL=1